MRWTWIPNKYKRSPIKFIASFKRFMVYSNYIHNSENNSTESSDFDKASHNVREFKNIAQVQKESRACK